MRVLFANHTGLVGGAEKALLDLMSSLPREVVAGLACPDGPLAAEAAARGVTVRSLPETRASLRLHPVHTPVGLAHLAGGVAKLRAASREVGADLIHANTVRAGLSAVAAARLGGPPAVVYLHDCLPSGRASAAARRALASGDTTIVANSGYTAREFGRDGVRGRTEVVYYLVDTDHFQPAAAGRSAARAGLGLGQGDPVLGLVAQITPWKGQDVAVEALARVRESHPRARLVLAGSTKFVSGATRFDNAAFLSSLESAVRERGLDGAVDFVGEHADVRRVMAALDVLLVPSWEEPFGRVVAEAMAMEVPVVATEVGGPAEMIEDGTSGRLLPPRDAARWAEAVAELLGDPDRARRMAGAGRAAIGRFSRERMVESMLAVYEDRLRRARA